MSCAPKPVVAGVGLVIDTDTKLTSSEGESLWAAGVRTIVRYGPLPDNDPSRDLTAAELQTLTRIGHTVVLIQHPRAAEYNILSATTGANDAEHILVYAGLIGYVPGAAIGLDMEGVQAGSDAFGHARAWVTAVVAAAYQPIVYLGYRCDLTTAQCVELARLGASVQFWSTDASPVVGRPDIAYAWHQHLPTKIAGVDVDTNDVLLNGAIFGIAYVPPTSTTMIPPPLPFPPNTQPPPEGTP